jgi:perosamine synthetase
MIDFFNTYVSPRASAAVSAVLKSGMLSEGQVTLEFEQQLSAEFGFKQVTALNSGTSALHLALALFNIGPGDEVIIPAQTFIATGLAVLYCGAKPVFADISYSDGNIDPASVESRITPRTRAIIAVHWAGYPCDMDALKRIADANGIRLIEDAAHALGAIYRDRPIGNISDVTCYSFQAIKHLTTGDGGAVTVTDEALHHTVRRLKWFGIDRHAAGVSELGEREYNLGEVGFKYHMCNYNAALGLANLEGYHQRLSHRQRIAEIYRSGLNGISGVQVFETEADRRSAHWLFGLHVQKRLEFIRKLKEHGIPASVVHQRIDRHAIFGGIDRRLVSQERFDDTQIHIPIHDRITAEDAERIVSVIKQGW